MGGNNGFFENFERNKYLKKLPSMQRVKWVNVYWLFQDKRPWLGGGQLRGWGDLLLDHYANPEVTDQLDRLSRDVAGELMHHDILQLLDDYHTLQLQLFHSTMDFQLHQMVFHHLCIYRKARAKISEYPVIQWSFPTWAILPHLLMTMCVDREIWWVCITPKWMELTM